MKYSRLFQFSFLFALLVSFVPSAFAQLSVTDIGRNSERDQVYQCVRYVDPSLNSIAVVGADGSERFIAPRTALKILKNRFARLNQQTKQLQKRLQQAQRRLNSITTLLDQRPETIRKRERIRNFIERIEERLPLLERQRREIISFGNAVKACQEEAVDRLSNGSVQIIQKLYELSSRPDETRFWAGIYYVIQEPLNNFDPVCIRRDGEVTKVTVSVEPCIVSRQDSLTGPRICEERLSGLVGFQLGGGKTGPQDPGTCSPASDCSLAAAVAELSALLPSLGNIQLLGRPSSKGSCARFE